MLDVVLEFHGSQSTTSSAHRDVTGGDGQMIRLWS